MGFQGVEKKRGRQQVCAAARTEVTRDEGSMHRRCSLAPLRLPDTALFEKIGRRFLREAQANGTTTVKQIGVFHRRQDCKEPLYARGLSILGYQPAAEPQCGQPHLDRVRKAGGGLRPRAARAKSAQSVRSMAVQWDGAAHDGLPPSLAYGGAQYVGAPIAVGTRRRRPGGSSGRAQKSQTEDCTSVRVDAACRGQHRTLCLQSNLAELVHTGSNGTGGSQITVKRCDGRGAGYERARVHVGMTA